jgi:succinate dehydrogenase/fumarate reductase flavoprotein subunit
MIKKLIVAGLLVVGTANAGMFDSVAGAAGVGGGSSSAKEVSGDALDATIKNYSSARTLLQKSSDILASALLSKEDAAKFSDALKVAEATTDPKEREAAINKVVSDEQTAIKAAAESKDTQAKLKNADAKTKQLVSSGGFNFLLSGLKYKDTLTAAKDMVSSLSSNPTAAMKYSSQLGQLKDMVSTLPDSVSSIASIGGKLVDLFKTAGVKFTPPTDSKQPEAKASEK